MTKTSKRVGWIAAGFMAASAVQVHAADFSVTNGNDAGVGSLRQAILDANANMGPDTITLNIPIVALPSPIIVLAADLPPITDEVVIAPGTDALNVATPVVDGAGAYRIFDVASMGPVSISGLTLTNASADSGSALRVAMGSTVNLSDSTVSNNAGVGSMAVSAADEGGAVDNAGTLTISNTDFLNNTADTGAGSGGAIISSGTLDITGGTFDSNSAQRAGGAIEMNSATAVTTLNGVTFTGNFVDGTPGNGGAIHVGSSGTTNITNCDFSGNSAGEGGALWNGSGVMTIVGGSIMNNTATATDPTNGPAGDNGGPTSVAPPNARGGGGIMGLIPGGTIDISGGTVISGNDATGNVSSGGGIFMNENTTLIADGITLSGNTANRAGGGIEMRASSTVTLTNVTLDDNTANTTATGGGGNGGGVHMTGNGTFSMTNSTVTNNTAVEGGGLWNGSGTMTIVGGSITGNDATGGTGDAGDNSAQGGGGIFGESPGGTVDLSGGTMIMGNTASGDVSSGGGIFMNVDSILVADGITIASNTANRAGGGIELRAGTTATLTNVTIDGNTANPTGGGGGGNGGGVHITGNGNITVNGGTVSNNTAQEGGGLWNGSGTMTIVGGSITGNMAIGGTADTDPITNGPRGGAGLFANNAGGVIDISGGTTITDNIASGAVSSGGGILMKDGSILTATDVTLSGNTANRAGGAIEVRANTMTTLTRVTMDGNTAFTTGDGSTGAGGNGGGLHQTGAGSVTTINSSTVSNNVAANEGGGLWSFNNSTLNLNNSTVFGNESMAANGGGGGGLFIRPDSTMNSVNSTIAGNTATGGPGGGVQLSDATTSTFNATNTLIGDNSSTMMGNDVAGTVTGSNNLVEDAGGATLTGSNNISGMDAVLGALANNGGTTLTVLPGTGSPAIDAGDNAACAAAPINNVDQRGAAFVRPLDGDGSGSAMCDIGAIEVQVQPVVVLIGNGNTGAGGVINVDAGSQGVAALAFGLVNNSGEAVTVNSLSGTLSGSGNFGADVQASLVLDANGNGTVDAGEIAVPANVVINSLGKGAGGTFTVTFTPAIVVPNGSTFNYILSVNFAADLAMATVDMKLLSGGSLALIGLAGLGALRGRRRLLVVAMVVGAASLGGCGGGNGDGTGLFGQTETFQFRLSAVNGQGNTSGTPILVGGPIDGPTLRAIER